MTITNGHNAVNTRSHWSCCFSSITAAMPDAVGAAGKPMEDVRSRLIARINFVKVDRPETDHRRPTLRRCWYSGVKSWAELLIWAYSPPMGLYRTIIVQGLSIAHGRGERRQDSPGFPSLRLSRATSISASYTIRKSGPSVPARPPCGQDGTCLLYTSPSPRD